MAKISFGRLFTELAAQQPDRPSVSFLERRLSRRELESQANQWARAFAEEGVGEGGFVTIALPNGVEFIVACVACWKLGTIPQPVSSRLPLSELTRIVELADSALVVGDDPANHPRRACLPADFRPPAETDDSPLPDVVSKAWKAPTSGGSSGRPKLIVSGDPALWDTEAPPMLLIQRGGSMVMPGPLYHNGPFIWTMTQLLAGGLVALLPRFDPLATLEAIERHRADIIYLVPTMMHRIWRLPEEDRLRPDLSSLSVVWHLAAPCPGWLKQAWIDWLGPERIWELYGGTEAQASTIIRGDQWLEHRGSVGRPISGEVCILDAEGRELPPGAVGEVYMRPVGRDQPTYHYIGAEARKRGGWESLGDIGYLDEEGYLYLVERLDDMVVSGGANIYPAEVEAALDEHPRVASSAVIGLPDEDLGQRLHAIVQRRAEVSAEELLDHLAERLVRYKIPRSIEIVDEPLRNEAGKMSRSALRAARLDES
jgi:bile acid-coenzyme A ligase